MRPDRYSKKFKGYLTYPPDNKIVGILLEDYYITRYRVKYDYEEEWFEDRTIDKEIADILDADGAHVEKIKHIGQRGRKKLFDIPVEIRKRKEGIRIRLTEDTEEDIMKDIEFIKGNMRKFGIEPKECIWGKDNNRYEIST